MKCSSHSLFFYDVLVILIGTCNLAPESLPIIVNKLYNVDVAVPTVPNKVLTPVATNVSEVPITVFDTSVPLVVVEFKVSAASVSIPDPTIDWNCVALLNVNTYPDDSTTELLPK